MKTETSWAPEAIIVKHLESTPGSSIRWLVTLPNSKRYKVTTYPEPSMLALIEIPHPVDPRFGLRIVHLKKSTVDSIRKAIKGTP